MIRIWNEMDFSEKLPPARDCIYIGRPSLLGNPFSIREHGTREKVIELYRAWLRKQYLTTPAIQQELDRLAAEHRAGKDVNLVCYCKPLPCHGDVIQDAIEKLAERG